MELTLDTRPYILYETIAMLTKYVNRISMLDIRDTLLRLYRSGLDETWRRRLECLQEIIGQVCADVDREDPEIQYFFSKRELSGPTDQTNLARVLTHPFIEWQSPNLEEEAEALKEAWQRLQERGFRLASGTCGISFVPLPAGETQGSLFRQLYQLHLPGDLAMEILSLFEDYTGSLDRLVALIIPYARRLEEQLTARPWLMESLGAYWAEQFQTISPESFLAGSKMGYRAPPVNPQRRVCFSLMACTEIQFEIQNSVLHPGRSLYVFGCSIAAICSQGMFGEDTEQLAMTFRTLGSKSRLVLLLRLAQDRGYCQQLAAEAQCNTGDMSRSLTALSKCGFLKQEQEQSRTYYAADLPAISRFLEEFHNLLARRQEK